MLEEEWTDDVHHQLVIYHVMPVMARVAADKRVY
jgi:hypothetical protein